MHCPSAEIPRPDRLASKDGLEAPTIQGRTAFGPGSLLDISRSCEFHCVPDAGLRQKIARAPQRSSSSMKIWRAITGPDKIRLDNTSDLEASPVSVRLLELWAMYGSVRW